MPNITETISLLDELKAKATQGEWKADAEYDWSVVANGKTVFDDGSAGGEYSPSCADEDRNYIIALHNNLPALRQAALDGERYRKEAEAAKLLVNAVEETLEYDPEDVTLKIEEAFENYRQAVEQKEV